MKIQEVIYLAGICICIGVALAAVACFGASGAKCEQRTPIEVPVCSYKEPK